jgi:lysophospholipase L1-like esterase
MMLSGNTILAGDSITVRLSPYVKVDGSKREVAEGGRPTAWLLAKLRKLASTGGLHGFQNLVVLIGTNDIGGGRPVSDLVQDIRSIWRIGKDHGMRVYAQTIPPVKGYTGFKNFAAVNERRKAINEALGQAFVSGEADGLIDISALMADPQDPDKLAKAYDGGDHIHPRKDAHGALLTQALGAAPPIVPTPLPVQPEPSLLPLVLIAGVGAGFYLLSRKR